MTEDEDSKSNLTALRSRAEAAILGEHGEDNPDLPTLTKEDMQRLIHELWVHQVELEMQNEELDRARVEADRTRERYLDLFDYAPVGYFTLDKNAIILEANLTGSGLLGAERISLIDKPLTSFIHRDDQDTFYLHRNQVLQTETQHISEIKLVKSHGGWFHAQLQSVRIADPKGGPGLWRTAVTDITDRALTQDALRHVREELELRVKERTSDLLKANEALKVEIAERYRAEEALKQSELRLNLALSGAGLGSWDYNVETGETVCDRRLAEMLGFPLDQTQPHAPWWENLTHPDDWPRTMEIFNAHMEGHTPLYEAEFRVRPRLGDWKWILARGSVVERDKDGKPLRVAGTYLDITERKRAEEALRQSEERFRAIFDGAGDMIFMMDSRCKYVQINPAMAKTLGLDVSEIVGRKPEDIYGEEVGKQLRLLDLRVLGGESIEREHTVRIKGVSLTLNTVLRPLYNAEGEIFGVFGISRDLTERSRALLTPKAAFESYPSAAMRTTMREARSAAVSDGTVLLQGESGSGKDYLARWIHDHSKRAVGPYFSLNCAAISRELAESELFGHERGAFTGALGRKRGLLELAEGGTLLLNEIGELPLSLQSKLLTFLDTRSFLRVGGEKRINVNARIISATNRSLDKEVEEGRFLSALFYRINVFGITVPPLRDRIEDIPILLEEIMSRLAVELQLTHLPYIDPAFAIALTRYDWPGNVREFRNVLERSLMLSDGPSLSLALPSSKASSENWSHVSSFPLQERTLHDVTDEVIKSLILEALRRCEGNRRHAARMLGIARDSLYRHMKRFGIMSENQPKDQY
ncbi:MAG: sigma 54-interacting transcriptional regulator [Deltaproteobacteria bacterium]|nr:sigma 54-interacting transcriptional regulator [Deltaproteobacteria bacterium]